MGNAHAGIHAQKVGGFFLLHLKAVQAHHNPFIFFDFLLIPVGAVLDFLLDEALFNGGGRPAHLVYFPNIILRPFADLPGQGFQEIGASQGIHRVDHPGFVGDELLGAQGDLHGLLGRKTQRFVHGVGVQRLGAAQDGGQSLKGHPHNVVHRLPCGQGATRSLGMKTDHQGSGVFGPEAFFHDFCPERPGCSELGDFFKEIEMGIEKKGKPGAESIHVQACLKCGIYVSNAVSQGESNFLDRSGACFPYVVSANADAVPLGHPVRAEGKNVGNDPHGGLGGENEGPPGGIFLQNVILDGSPQLFSRDPLLFRNGKIHGQEHGGRGIDGHGGAHLVQGDAAEQDFHVLE